MSILSSPLLFDQFAGHTMPPASPATLQGPSCKQAHPRSHSHLVAFTAGRCATTELPLLPGAEKDEAEEEVATTPRCSSGSLNASTAVTLPGAEPDLQTGVQ
jgi:hypothetical protein